MIHTGFFFQVFFPSSYVSFYDPQQEHRGIPTSRHSDHDTQQTNSSQPSRPRTKPSIHFYTHADRPSITIGNQVWPFTQYVRLLTIFTKEASKPTISPPSQKNHIHRIEKGLIAQHHPAKQRNHFLLLQLCSSTTPVLLLVTPSDCCSSWVLYILLNSTDSLE